MKCTSCRNIEFITLRDGEERGQAFAKQTRHTYRKVLVGSGRVKGIWMRRGMIEAYLCAKEYLRVHRLTG